MQTLLITLTVLSILLFVVSFFRKDRVSILEKNIEEMSLQQIKEIYILNLGIGVVAAVIYALFVWYYGSCVDVEFLQRYIDAQEHIYLNNWQGTTEDMNMMIENIKTLTTVPYLSVMGGILTVVTSFIVAFIVAILLRTQKNVVRQKK